MRYITIIIIRVAVFVKGGNKNIVEKSDRDFSAAFVYFGHASKKTCAESDYKKLFS